MHFLYFNMQVYEYKLLILHVSIYPDNNNNNREQTTARIFSDDEELRGYA